MRHGVTPAEKKMRAGRMKDPRKRSGYSNTSVRVPGAAMNVDRNMLGTVSN